VNGSREHTLRGGGADWSFFEYNHSPAIITVRVRSHPQMDGRSPLVLIHQNTLSRRMLSQLPADAVREELERARLFTREPHFAKFYNHDDYTTDSIRVGVRMSFPAPRYTVTLTREDARRLWIYLSRSSA
jgi:hypothetical protein